MEVLQRSSKRFQPELECSQAKSSEESSRVQQSSNFEIKRILAYSLLPLAENIAWQLWFVVQFCILFNSSLKFKERSSSFRQYN